MITHDILAFSCAQEALRRIRGADPAWALFAAASYATSSRTGWPLPDFVIRDPSTGLVAAAEFKPPNQTKREYLTGLGQAFAYTRDFANVLLVIPELADDGTAIAEHLRTVLDQQIALDVPIALVSYDQNAITSTHAPLTLLTPLRARQGLAPAAPSLANSFWAKWRDASPQELGLYLEHLYTAGRSPVTGMTARDQAWDLLWLDIQAGRAEHWGGGTRTVANTPANKEAWGKNYRNFVAHIGWMLNDGKLTEDGLDALRAVHLYGHASTVFTDLLARSVLLTGRHLILINSINEFQDSGGHAFPTDAAWRSAIEAELDANGMLERNPGRHGAAVMAVPREFMKAEKTIWRNLGFIVPTGAGGGRAVHLGRGMVFNWRRITGLLG